MSKPETPQIIDIMGALKASLAAHPNAKPNAPKAEAPKPETPCQPGCMTTHGRGGDIISHARYCQNANPVCRVEDEPWCSMEGGKHHPACADAPKAEAPPKPEEWQSLHDGVWGKCECLNADRRSDSSFPHRIKPEEPAPPAPIDINEPSHNQGCEDGFCTHGKPAPHANVSEPLVHPTVALEDVLKQELEECRQAKEAAELDSSASIAALQEAHDHAQEGLKSARKQEGEMRQKIAALTTELERLRFAADRVVKHRNKHYRDVRETVDTLEAVLARAAREAGETS